MDNLVEKLLHVLYRKRDAAERVATELDTLTSDDLLIKFFEGKAEAYQEVIDMLINNKNV
jgi:hypothetical protein